MTDRAKFEQMLEYLINEDKEKAEELFHELVVAKSREIYENLLDDDIQVEEKEEDEEDEEMEEGFEMDEVGGDATDDFLGDIEAGDDEFDGADDFEGDDVGGTEPATKDDVMDIKDALEDLKAEFEAMLNGEEAGEEEGEEEFGGEEEGEEEFGGEEESEEDEETEEGYVREYVEKVPAGHGTEKKGGSEASGANTKSPVAGKNDMGGTTANILSGRNGSDAGLAGAAGGQLKGNGVFKGSKPQLQDAGNVNVPGGNAGKSGFKKKEPGHGAEKKGAGEGGVDGKSIIGSRK